MKRSVGFTLVELLVTLVVLAVALGLAAPSFRTLVNDTRQDSSFQRLNGALLFARSEAIKSTLPVTLCARATDVSCGQDWSNGVLVFSDSAADGASSVFDGSDVLLRVEQLQSTDMAIAATARSANGVQPVSTIRFNRLGETNWLDGTFVFCDQRGRESAKGLVFAGSGLSRQATSANHSGGVVQDASGSEVQC